MNYKVLITGGLGYIGSYFVENYSHKYDLKIYDSNLFQYDYSKNSLFENIVIKDLREISLQDVLDVDFVIHMGELSNDPLGDFNKHLTNEINHVATGNLLNLLNKTDVKKFIYMSSASVYGYSEDIMSETSSVSPLTEYAKAKIKNEEYILENEFSFESIILRNSTAFGFSKNLRLDLVVNDLTYLGFTEKKLTLFSDGTPVRPIVHIADISQAIDLLINDRRKLDKQIFNIGSNEMNFSIKDIAEKVAECLSLSTITFGDHDPDQRSYKLEFNKFMSYFPNFEIKYDLKEGINNLIHNFKSYSLTGSEKRMQSLKELIADKKVDENLFFMRSKN